MVNEVWRRSGGIEPHTFRKYTGFEVRCQGPPQPQITINAFYLFYYLLHEPQGPLVLQGPQDAVPLVIIRFFLYNLVQQSQHT